MKLIKIIFAFGLFAILNGCYGDAGTGDWFGNIGPGQWTTPTSMGGDKFLTEGYRTRDAIKGATQFCVAKNKTYEVVTLTPHASDSNATLIFKCS